MTSPLATPPVRVFGYADCARTDDVLAHVVRLGVRAVRETLDRSSIPTGGLVPLRLDPCGYVSPTVELPGRRSPSVTLVQPTEAELADALARHGLLPGLHPTRRVRTAQISAA